MSNISTISNLPIYPYDRKIRISKDDAYVLDPYEVFVYCTLKWMSAPGYSDCVCASPLALYMYAVSDSRVNPYRLAYDKRAILGAKEAAPEEVNIFGVHAGSKTQLAGFTDRVADNLRAAIESLNEKGIIDVVYDKGSTVIVSVGKLFDIDYDPDDKRYFILDDMDKYFKIFRAKDENGRPIRFTEKVRCYKTWLNLLCYFNTKDDTCVMYQELMARCIRSKSIKSMRNTLKKLEDLKVIYIYRQQTMYSGIGFYSAPNVIGRYNNRNYVDKKGLYVKTEYDKFKRHNGNKKIEDFFDMIDRSAPVE